MVGKYERAGLVDLKLEEYNGKYCLNATYEYENDYGIYELIIPHIDLPINTRRLPLFDTHNFDNIKMIDIGFGETFMYKDFRANMTHTIREIAKKPRKMTLAEIEKQLGYKIELVDE